MSSLIWSSLTVVLGIELVVLVTLCLPFRWGVRKNISRWIVRIKARKRLQAVLKYIWTGLGIALMESVYSLRSIDMQDQSQLPLLERKLSRVNAERNMYLSGFAIVVLLAISRLVHLATIEVELRSKIKQFNGNKPITETGETIAPASEKTRADAMLRAHSA